jgi:DNA-directed RNA polymerase sigma subunit (sigma70/sigma32)
VQFIRNIPCSIALLRNLLHKFGQELIGLEEAKEKFISQYNRVPTSIEWAQTVGLSCGAIDSSLLLGKCSLEKIVKTNFHLVLSIAKQHVGRGVDLQDLVQVD